MHCCARPGEQYNCESIQATISGDTSRCQWACAISFNSMPWPASVFWSPPDVVHHWGCRLPSLHRGSPGRLSHTCTCQCRGKHWDPPTRDPAVEGQQPASMRRQDLRVDTAVWVGNIWCTNKLHTTETLQDGNTSEGGHVRLHRCALCISFHTTDYRILKVSLHVHIGVSRGPQALWPSCLWRQT